MFKKQIFSFTHYFYKQSVKGPVQKRAIVRDRRLQQPETKLERAPLDEAIYKFSVPTC